MRLEDVLWIGGGQGSGKSSVARALSRRSDLQLYVADHRTWTHLPRMAETEFDRLSMNERWVEASPERMLTWFLETSRARFELVLEDVAALPASPMAVVEGAQLFPAWIAPVLSHRDQALFLVSDPAAQRERLLARGPLLGTSDGVRARANATARDLLISERVVHEAQETGLTVFYVDRPLDAMSERAATFFASALARGPRTADLATIRRAENDVLATQVRLYRASLSDAKPEDGPLPFACECGASGCAAVVELALADYDARAAAGATARPALVAHDHG